MCAVRAKMNGQYAKPSARRSAMSVVARQIGARARRRSTNARTKLASSAVLCVAYGFARRQVRRQTEHARDQVVLRVGERVLVRMEDVGVEEARRIRGERVGHPGHAPDAPVPVSGVERPTRSSRNAIGYVKRTVRTMAATDDARGAARARPQHGARMVACATSSVLAQTVVEFLGLKTANASTGPRDPGGPRRLDGRWRAWRSRTPAPRESVSDCCRQSGFRRRARRPGHAARVETRSTSWACVRGRRGALSAALGARCRAAGVPALDGAARHAALAGCSGGGRRGLAGGAGRAHGSPRPVTRLAWRFSRRWPCMRAGMRWSAHLHPGGDEPHYLIISHSLLEDGDLRIQNNHDNDDYAAFFQGRLAPDFLRRGTDDRDLLDPCARPAGAPAAGVRRVRDDGRCRVPHRPVGARDRAALARRSRRDRRRVRGLDRLGSGRALRAVRSSTRS